MELQSLDDVILALGMILEQTRPVHTLEQVVFAQKRQPDVLHEIGEVLAPLGQVMLDPGDDGLVDAFLGGDGDRVRADQIPDLVVPQAEELVAVQDLREVTLNVRFRLSVVKRGIIFTLAALAGIQ